MKGDSAQSVQQCRNWAQSKNVSQSNLQVFNAILYIVEHGSMCRGLPVRTVW